jgi:ribosomal protein uL22
MPHYTYAFQGNEQAANKTARAVGRSIPVSTKQSVEICAMIRGKPVAYAKRLLEDAKNFKRPLAFKRFVNGHGHKSGMGPGRYAPTTATLILATIASATKNAQTKNLGDDLIIIHACAHHASHSYRYGRQSRRKEKRTHVEIVLAPRAEAKAARMTQTALAKATKAKAAPEKTL